jgi:hypothetical protein
MENNLATASTARPILMYDSSEDASWPVDVPFAIYFAQCKVFRV